MISESKDRQYIEQIIRYATHADLLTLWRAIAEKATPEWPDGKALEYLVLRAFELEGAQVRWPFRVHVADEEVEQIDGVVYTDGLACLIECKDEAKPVNVEPIAKLRNQLLRRPSATIGIIFASQGFTEPARILAGFVAPQTILLWSGVELSYALQHRFMRAGLLMKYHQCIERALPDYNIRLANYAVSEEDVL